MLSKLPTNLYEKIKEGESTTVEFKKGKEKLPSSLFESVCGMLNRNGGHIFLGVDDDGKVIGTYKSYIASMKKDFANLCNNPEKVFPTVHLEMKEYSVDDKIILYIYIYESSDVHKSVGKIYDRNEDGDFDITNNTTLVSNLYIRKSSTYIENKIFPYATIDDLRKDLIEKARQMAVNRTANHPWASMNDMELLRSASLYEKDLQTGKEGINLAGILLFGKDEVIASALSYYRTDAILRVKDIDRYDDRDDIKTNLLESYERLVSFIAKHLNDKFYLENNQRINVRDIIARELCVNMLIHREYSNPLPARLIITKDAIITENANKPKNIGYIDLYNYTPYPKNPKLANFFKEIGLADELGSGIKKITKYNKIYTGGIPSFKDDDVFKVIVPLETNKVSLEQEHNLHLDENKEKLYNFIKENGIVTRKEINNFLAPVLKVNNSKDLNNKIRYMLAYLRKNNLIENIGTDKKSQWVIK